MSTFPDASFTSETYDPDNLLAGDVPKPVTSYQTLASGQTVVRGALLGKVTSGGAVVLSLSASTDGSEDPLYIAAEARDASGGAAGILVYEMGEFNQDRVTFGTGHSAASVKEELAARNIYLRDPVTKEPA